MPATAMHSVGTPLDGATGLQSLVPLVRGALEGLFYAALERYIESTKKLYQKYPEKNDLESLETLADAYARSEKLGEAASWGCLMLNTITANEGVSSEFHSKIEEFRLYAIEKIEALLRASCAKGEIADRSKIVVHGRNLSS